MPLSNFERTLIDVLSKIQRYGTKSKLERAGSLQGRIVDEAISALPKWTKYGKKEVGRWSPWHHAT